MEFRGAAMDVLSQLKLILITAPAQPGLAKQRDREEEKEEEANDLAIPNPVLIMNCSLVKVPVQALTAMIRSQVPVVEYARFLERRGHGVGKGESINGGCAVCLSSSERRGEFRELSTAPTPSTGSAWIAGWTMTR